MPSVVQISVLNFSLMMKLYFWPSKSFSMEHRVIIIAKCMLALRLWMNLFRRRVLITALMYANIQIYSQKDPACCCLLIRLALCCRSCSTVVNQEHENRQMRQHLQQSKYVHTFRLFDFISHWHTNCVWHTQLSELYELVSINRVQLFFMLLLLLHKVLWYLFFQSGLFLDICPGSHSVCIHTELISKSDSERQKMGYSQ